MLRNRGLGGAHGGRRAPKVAPKSIRWFRKKYQVLPASFRDDAVAKAETIAQALPGSSKDLNGHFGLCLGRILAPDLRFPCFSPESQSVASSGGQPCVAPVLVSWARGGGGFSGRADATLPGFTSKTQSGVYSRQRQTDWVIGKRPGSARLDQVGFSRQRQTAVVISQRPG